MEELKQQFLPDQNPELVIYLNGDWVMVNDEKSVIWIKRDSITEIYKNAIRFECLEKNDEIEAITYKKWFAKYASERGSLQIEINNLSKNKEHFLDKLERLIPVLCNLKNLYHSLKLSGKQALLKKVFEGGLTWDGTLLRTPRLHLALFHNYMRIKEKRLLLVEQPEEILANLTSCTAYGIRTRITTVKGWCPSP